MSLFDIFKSPAQVTTTVNGQQAGMPAQQGQPVAPNNTDTSGTQPQLDANGNPISNNNSSESKAPLDQFNTLWETDPNNTAPGTESIFANLDPAKIFEAAKNANFAGTISQENLQAISQGGEPAMRAFQEAMNAATQAVFAQSTLATTKIVEQALAKQAAKYEEAIPNLVRKHAASDSLHTENPALSNPAAQPIISAIQAQLAIKHPNATATQLKTMAKDYLENFANLVTPTKEPPKDPKAQSDDVDWSSFLNS